MNQYMIEIGLPIDFDEEYQKLVPDQREHIAILMEQGVIISHSLSVDRTKIWIVMKGRSEDQILEFIAKFPLKRYVNFKIFQLASHSRQGPEVPPMFMN